MKNLCCGTDLRVYLTAPTPPSQITLVPTPTPKHFIDILNISDHLAHPSTLGQYLFSLQLGLHRLTHWVAF